MTHDGGSNGDDMTIVARLTSKPTLPWYFVVKVIIYVGTGILQPLLIDSLRIKSCLGHKWLLLPTLANTMGMACCGLLGTSAAFAAFRNRYQTDASFRRGLYFTAAVDLISGMMLTGGILLTGGAVFVVLYNSCPAWTALLSKYVLGKLLSFQQTAGVLLVCAGLITNVLGSNLQMRDSNDTDTNSAINSGPTVMVGSIIVLLGCVLHSAFFVLSDRSLRGCHHSRSAALEEGGGVVSAPVWSCCLGSMESVFMALWVTVGVFWKGFQEENENIGSCVPRDFGIGFVTLLVVDAAHAAAFFLLLKQIGAVGSALLKGMQAVVVVLVAALLFCPHEKAQCPTPIKAGSIVMVLSGTIWYAIASSNVTKVGSDAMPEEVIQLQQQSKFSKEPPSIEVESLLS